MNKNYLGADEILRKRREFLFPCLNNFYIRPPQFVRGEMQYLFDGSGKKYLDFFAGVSVMNCGHSNPFIIQRVIDQMSLLQHVTNIYLTEPIVRLAEKLSKVYPGEINNSFFCNSGSEANEGALTTARIYTGRREFIALESGLHGRTHMTMSATAIPMWRADPYLSEDINFIPCSYAADGNTGLAAEKSIHALCSLLKDKAESIAAFIAEPIQANGGIITPPDWYFVEVSKLLKQYGILFIADEIQTGFARTGKMFGIEHYSLAPDIITVSKALGNGIPISAFAATPEIASKFTSPSASTLGGNPASCASALAVLDYIEKENLCERAQSLGNKLLQKLLELKSRTSIIKDVRGKGLMLGAELRSADNRPLSNETDAILEMLKDDGVILGKNGMNRNVLAFQPPLVINEEDIEFLMERLEKAVVSVEKTIY